MSRGAIILVNLVIEGSVTSRIGTTLFCVLQSRDLRAGEENGLRLRVKKRDFIPF